jgi:hypothetical protein
MGNTYGRLCIDEIARLRGVTSPTELHNLLDGLYTYAQVHGHWTNSRHRVDIDMLYDIALVLNVDWWHLWKPSNFAKELAATGPTAYTDMPVPKATSHQKQLGEESTKRTQQAIKKKKRKKGRAQRDV